MTRVTELRAIQLLVRVVLASRNQDAADVLLEVCDLGDEAGKILEAIEQEKEDDRS